MSARGCRRAMRARFLSALVTSALFAMSLMGCGGSPTSPRPSGPPTPPPVISRPRTLRRRSRRSPCRGAVRGSRPGSRISRETVDVTATVRDPETSVDELTYQWTASAGTFTGTGRSVTWTAPDAATTPAKVALTLKVIEAYGHPGQPKNFSQEVSAYRRRGTARFTKRSPTNVRTVPARLLDTNIKDWRYIMRNFNAAACPNPDTVEEEKLDVIRHYSEFHMINSRVSDGKVSVSFGSFCPFRGRREMRAPSCRCSGNHARTEGPAASRRVKNYP